MKELIKETFEIMVKLRWLKTIDKEVDKYNKLNNKANRQAAVVNELVKKYNSIYGDNIKVGCKTKEIKK